MCRQKCIASLFCSSKHTCTNVQTCSPSLQPWEWRMLRFKVISSIRQPGALHCQCTASSFLLTHALKLQALAHCWVGVHSTLSILQTHRCLSGENMILRGSNHIHKRVQVWIFYGDTIICFCFSGVECPAAKGWKVWLWDKLLFSINI